MNPLLINGAISLVSNFVDKFVEDKDQAAKLKAQAAQELHTMDMAELKAATEIITAEAKGGSWIQNSWRPITMLVFLGLLIAYWFGFSPDNLSDEIVIKLFDLLEIGIGGYIAGRTAEKIAGPAVKEYIKRK